MKELNKNIPYKISVINKNTNQKRSMSCNILWELEASYGSDGNKE